MNTADNNSTANPSGLPATTLTPKVVAAETNNTPPSVVSPVLSNDDVKALITRAGGLTDVVSDAYDALMKELVTALATQKIDAVKLEPITKAIAAATSDNGKGDYRKIGAAIKREVGVLEQQMTSMAQESHLKLVSSNVVPITAGQSAATDASVEVIETDYGVYHLTDDAVLFAGLDGDKRPVKISSRLEVVANANDPNTEEGWAKVIRWKNLDGAAYQVAVLNAELVAAQTDTLKMLAHKGLQVMRNRKELLLNYIGGVQDLNRMFCTDTAGWYGDGDQLAFVAPTKIYGSGNYVFQSDQAIQSPMAISGTLPEWQTSVAKLCLGNSRMMFTVAVALASPLLGVSQVDNAGFHFYGGSSKGKSIAGEAGAGVWGDPKKYRHSWRTTTNAMENLAKSHNQGFMILDELGQADPKALSDYIYMLSQGEGKSRAGSDMSARLMKTWSILYVSTGEYSTAGLAQQAGENVAAGVEVRLVNIPADAGQGMGVIEQLNGYKDSGELVAALQTNTRQYYGAAGDTWLTMLAKPGMLNKVGARLQKEEKRLQKLWTVEGNPQSQRVAGFFAFVAAAAEIAAPLTRWPKGEATTAAKACFDAWLEEFGQVERETTNILNSVRQLVQRHTKHFQPINGPTETHTVDNMLGFKVFTKPNVDTSTEKTQDGMPIVDWNFELCVMASQIDRLVSHKGTSAGQIKEVLHKAGWIESDKAESRYFKEYGQHRVFVLNIPA